MKLEVNMSNNVNYFALWTPYITLVLGFIFGLIGTYIGTRITHSLQSKESSKQKQHQIYAELLALHKVIVEISANNATSQINSDYYNRLGAIFQLDDRDRNYIDDRLRISEQTVLQTELTRIQIYKQFYEVIATIRSAFPWTKDLRKHVVKCSTITGLDMTDPSLGQINNRDALNTWLRNKDAEIRDRCREQISHPITELIRCLKQHISP
jgi:hypothetical protein